MNLSVVVLFPIGIAVLVAGAELLVRGSARLATRAGLSPVVIGLTVVALGTSTPELAVSARAALRRETELALGNIVGSNIANVLLVLGLAALIGGGLVVAQRLVRIDVPVMVAASALVLVLALDGTLGRWEGAVLLATLVVYVVWTVRAARREGPRFVAEHDEALHPERIRERPVAADLAFVVLGAVGLGAGASLVVTSAVEVADALGVSSLVIGLTLVAVATSLPEAATSVVAAVRGERDIAVGNVVGSNLFNLFGVLGFTAVVAPGGLDVRGQVLGFDLPVMLAVAVACLPVFFTGWAITRWEGGLFFSYYLVYLGFLVLDRTDHSAAGWVGRGLGFFVLPLTAVTLAVVAAREWRHHRSRAGRSPPAGPRRM